MARRTETNLSQEFLEEEITLRGTTYHFRELSGAKYEECIKLAEGEDGTADLATVLRLMIPESLVSPKWDAEKIYSKPLPVVTAIQNLVNKMHFTPAVDEKNGIGEKPDEDIEDTPKNESEPPTF